MGQPVLSDEALLITHWVLTIVGLILLCARLYVRVYLRFWEWHWADILGVLGFIFACAWTAGETGLYVLSPHSTPPAGLTQEQHLSWLYNHERSVLMATKVDFFAYLIGIWLIKYSMLCLYSEMITKDAYYRLWIALNMIWWLTTLFCILFLAEVIFWCPNVADEYTFQIDLKSEQAVYKCSAAVNDSGFYKALSGSQLSIDFIIWVYPALIVYYLHLSRRQKFGVALLFFLGFLFLGVGCASVALYEYESFDNSWSKFGLSWTQFLAVVISNGIACKRFTRWIVIPGIRNMWQKLFGKEVLTQAAATAAAQDEEEERASFEARRPSTISREKSSIFGTRASTDVGRRESRRYSTWAPKYAPPSA